MDGWRSAVEGRDGSENIEEVEGRALSKGKGLKLKVVGLPLGRDEIVVTKGQGMFSDVPQSSLDLVRPADRRAEKWDSLRLIFAPVRLVIPGCLKV